MRSHLNILLATLLLGCGSDNEVRLQRKELRTEFNTYDAGITSVGERAKFGVTLESIAPGPVTVFKIQSSHPDDFMILDSWMTEDSDNDGVNDSLTIAGGSKDNPTQVVIPVIFSPSATENAGELVRTRFYDATLTVLSNDLTALERTEEGFAIWRTSLRGVGATPCAKITPQFIDYGKRPAGGYFPTDFQIRNCSQVPLTISAIDFNYPDPSTPPSFSAATNPPIYIFTDDVKSVSVAWVPASDTSTEVEVSLKLNDPEFSETVTIVGNSCENSNSGDYDLDNDGWTECGGDCDDEDPNINPSEIEIINGIDDNCDGEQDEENLV